MLWLFCFCFVNYLGVQLNFFYLFFCFEMMDLFKLIWDIEVCSLNIYILKQISFWIIMLMDVGGICFCFFGLEESIEFYNKCLNNLIVVYIEK